MSINLTVPRLTEPLAVQLNPGETIFVLGANGTGKSSLLLRFASAARRSARRISASRQTWLQSSSLEFTPSQKSQFEEQLANFDMQATSRYTEQNPRMRSGLTLYDLIDAENVDARKIAEALRSGNVDKARELAAKTAPIAKINELLKLSNLDVKISVEGGDRLVASRFGGDPYGAAELSDGERNALLIAADILTSKPETLLIIDEPERHLHRSIISPLLTHLFRERSDCSFIVATHDLMLPVDNPDARVLLVRSCSYVHSEATHWDVDLIPASADIEENIKRDIVGARRRILFVEGTASSLDKPLYSLLFPGVSVRPKGSSRDVEQAVSGIRAAEALHWVQAWGIIDNDGRDSVTIASLEAKGIVAIPFYSVESIYYHPDLVKAVATRYAAMVGSDGEAKAKSAVQAALKAVTPHLHRLAARSAEKSIRASFFAGLPTLEQIEAATPIAVQIDTSQMIEQKKASLMAAVQAEDWEKIITCCPVRDTPALDAIARGIGLQNRHQYESAVLQTLNEDPAILALVRNRFGSLATELALSGE